MAITVKAGSRLFSNVCKAEFMAVKVPGGEIDITIGGVAPATSAAARTEGGAVVDGHGGGSSMGKRYVSVDDSVELLCTKPGDGVPALNGTPLEIKDAKAMPASD
jgi:hypothetical protein